MLSMVAMFGQKRNFDNDSKEFRLKKKIPTLQQQQCKVVQSISILILVTAGVSSALKKHCSLQ